MRTVVFGLAGVGLTVLAVALPATRASGPKAKPAKPDIRFNRDIRPILSDHCYRCHGPSARDGKAGLRLDDSKNALKDRGGYFDIDPGHPEKSMVLSRAMAPQDDATAMPPKASGVKPLTKEEIETLRAWIKDGAKYEKHWAFVDPVKYPTPSTTNKKWARNFVDSFVLQRLEAEGLKPSPEADKSTLLRRAALTLTGLPPTPGELDAFLKDKRIDAYERAVDRLMASPRYGEDQARYWLDAVRYSDTHGMHFDNERAVFPYRDWVVREMNEDLPYDKFALYQLAGDLLPHPTTDMRLATAYVRLNPTTNEGGAIEQEYLVKNTFDRVDTTSTVFLGLTMGCAKCHDHKYDPISQKDYYRMFAFFDSTADTPMDGNMTAPPPAIPAATAEEQKELDTYSGRIQGAITRCGVDTAKTWLTSNRVSLPSIGKWEVSEVTKIKSFNDDFDQETTPKTWKPISIEQSKAVSFIGQENAYAYVRTTLNSDQTQTITLQLNSDDGIKVWLNDKLVHRNKILRSVTESTDNVDVALPVGKSELRIKLVNATGEEGLKVSVGSAIQRGIAEVDKLKTPMEKDAATKRLYLTLGPDTDDAKLYRQSKIDKEKLEKTIPSCMVAEEMPKPRPTFILKRGEYSMPTDPVTRDIPAVFGSIQGAGSMDRLGLAKWIISPKNPLFARVIVNRVWQEHFGTGLVKTSEDFGIQGDWPSHPELLDTLAVWFQENGYSLKKLNRLLVTSAAFRQSSASTALNRQKDPEDRLISRGPRYRLDAEVIRDQALYVGGLLREKEGGRGFRPYQPAGLWEDVAYPDSDTAKYKMDMTPEIWRRSLYLFWKRTSPNPMMLAFDAPSRESCVVRRSRTNTPLQSLAAMNEPGFLEAARVFGEKIVKSKQSTPDRVRFAFESALGRSPSAQEQAVLVGAANRYLAHYEKDTDAAEAICHVGIYPRDNKLSKAEVATWMLVGSTLTNLDEFLTQH